MKISLVEDKNSDIDFFSDVVRRIDEVELTSTHTNLASFLAQYNKGTDIDYLFLDIYLGDTNIISHVKSLKKKYPDCEIIMYSSSDAYDDLYQAIVNGASGYVLKTTDKEELKNYINVILSGGAFVSPYMARMILTKMTSNFNKISKKLSDKEIETLKYLAQGWSYKKIAEEQNITMNGMKTRIRRMYQKLQAKNKLEAIYKFNKIIGS